MRRTQAKDCRDLPFPPEVVFEALLDWKHYPDWWPPEVRFELLEQTPERIGSRARVQPLGASFTCEIQSIEPNRQIVVGYDGVHVGQGIWNLEPTPTGTRACYAVDLEPQGLMPRFLSDFLDLAALHSAGMRRVFDGLERYLGKSAVGHR